MTAASLEYHCAAIAALERLVDKMSRSRDYGEAWAAKAYYLLDDLRSWLDEEEKRERGD